jgi:hypothetical protein
MLLLIITFTGFTYLLNKRLNGSLFQDVVQDFKMFSSKTGRNILTRNRYLLHFNLTGLICFILNKLAYIFNDFFAAALSDKIMLAISIAFVGLWLNLVREIYYADRYDVDFDSRDIRFGFYGGLTYGIFTLLLTNLL